MHKDQLAYSGTGYLSSLATDYVSGNVTLHGLYAYQPDIESFRQAIEQRDFANSSRAVLADALLTQYAGQEVKPEVERHIQALRDSKTYTVTTGHQLGLFSGPLYFVYKIISTINLAEKLAATYPDYTFVPVFWMATEDHDFEEINHFHAFDKTFQWNSDQSGAVGRFSVDGLGELIDQWQSEMPEWVGDQPWFTDLKTAYTTQPTLTAATRYLVDQWFGSYGLVCVDGDDTALKQLFSPHVLRELEEQVATKAIATANAELAELGYTPQVHDRDINLFYLTDQTRERIVPHEKGYAVLHTDHVFTYEEMQAEVAQHPERFSPNVILRPVYQETILPNIAYLGGGAEVAYWLQLKPVFETLGVFYPMILPRNSVLWMNERAVRKQKGLGLGMAELFRKENELIREVVIRSTNDLLTFEEERKALLSVYNAIEERMTKADQTLAATVRSAQVKQLNQLNKLEKKLLRAEKRNHEVDVQRVRAINEWIAPHGKPQERYVNVIHLLYAFGDSFFEILKEELDPLDFRLTVLSPEA